MIVTFNTLKVKNFLSVGELPVEIKFQKGLNLITGNNSDNQTRNGVGKSSVIEAIFWCLFGNTIRDIKNDKIIHNQSKKGCEVELNFDVIDSKNNKETFTIKRYLGPSKIEVWNGDKNITLSTIPANDEYIKTLIRANEELFNNSVIMTANNTLPFMAQKKIDKRKFIEGVLNLSIFNEMLLKTRSDYNEIKKENDLLSNSFINEQKNLEIFEKQIVKQKQQKEENINNFQKLIKNTELQIQELKTSDVDFLKLKETFEKNENKIQELENLSENINKNLIDLSSKLSEFKIKIEQSQKTKNELVKKKEICPICNRKYSNEEVLLVNEKIIEIDKEFNELTEQKNKTSVEIQNKNQKKEEIKKLVLQIKQKNKNLEEIKQKEELKGEKIKNLENKIEEYKENIKKTKNEKLDFEEEIQKINKKIKKIEDDLKNIKKKLAILDDVKFVLSEEGVKTYIVKKLIDLLNNKLNFYLKRLDAPCSCIFNEQFEETILNSNGKDCSYFNFSGGERKRIDIAVLFMFQDVLRFYSGASYSINMYDELFDSAIDEAGTDKIIEILRERIESYNESIYIVSHNKSSLKNMFDDIILLEKSKGKTVLVS
jgi:DNA repair exonuclease SbcCD ATPase subunit